MQAGLHENAVPDSSIRSRIQELMQRGLNAREIAMKMGMPVNDVELTIAKL